MARRSAKHLLLVYRWSPRRSGASPQSYAMERRACCLQETQTIVNLPNASASSLNHQHSIGAWLRPPVTTIVSVSTGTASGHVSPTPWMRLYRTRHEPHARDFRIAWKGGAWRFLGYGRTRLHARHLLYRHTFAC